MPDCITHKTCSACKLEKEIEQFGLSAGYKDGRRGQCNACRSAKHAQYNRGRTSESGHKVKADPLVTRRAKLKSKYGLTEVSFAALLESQDGVCAVCGSSEAGGRWNVFHVDHCHDSGEVRGLLCHLCNTTLGRLGDNLPSLMRFVSYLQRRT